MTINDSVFVIGAGAIDTTAAGLAAGGDITITGPVNGAGALTFSAGDGVGNVTLLGDVGTTVRFANVLVDGANNVLMNGALAADRLELNFGGNWSNTAGAPLEVGTLVVDAQALGAQVFGTVNGRRGRAAASQVDGPFDDPDFTINGCPMGPPCEARARVTKLPAVEFLDDVFPIVEPDLLTVWKQRRRQPDPREVTYSNLGNEELWWSAAPRERGELQ